MSAAAGKNWVGVGPSVEIDYGAGRPARIDGTIGSRVAVEVESRVFKQVRGAVLDLICHRYQKKLLVLLPVHMNDPEITGEQCRSIFRRFVAPEDFRVVVLSGDGEKPCVDEDAATVRKALRDLGCTFGVY